MYTMYMYMCTQTMYMTFSYTLPPYMACQSEKVLCLSFTEEVQPKDVVSKKDKVSEDEGGDEVMFTGGVQLQRAVLNHSANNNLV